MAGIRSELLEKAGFGKLQQENQDALATLNKEKGNLRVKRKLKEANTRAKQVKVKFDERFYGSNDSKARTRGEYDREALIKVGNQVYPTRVTFRYHKRDKNYPANSAKISVPGVFSTNWAAKQYGDVQNKTFKPGQLKQVLGAIKKRYTGATQILGERRSGIRKNASLMERTQSIILKGGGKSGKLARAARKGGLLGLGLSLVDAVRRGKEAYDAKEKERM